METTMNEQVTEAWNSGQAYEQYVGRWSRLVAKEFLAWLGAPSGQVWSDVGCGTGALVECVLAMADPKAVFAIDRSKDYLTIAQGSITDQRVDFDVADATALPWSDGLCDVTVSGLVLNFVSDAKGMVKEMMRVTRRNGTVGAYVWDYAGGMQMMRQFWDAALEVTPEDRALDQAERFQLCQPEPLKTLFKDAGLNAVTVRAIDIPTVFRDFDDYWLPFLGKQGAAPSYLASLDSGTSDRIREKLKARLLPSTDGSIVLSARAWAVQGTV